MAFRRSMALCLTALLCGLLLGRAQAQVTLYTSRPAFLAATTGDINIDFNGIAAPGSFVSYPQPPGLTLSGVTFTSNGSLFVIDPGYYGQPYADGGYLNSDYTEPDLITATLPGGVNAVGADIGSLFAGGTTFTITLSTGDVFVVPAPGSPSTGAMTFAGFISPSANITSIVFSTPDLPNYNAIDNFVFGTAAVPEPGALALLVSPAVAALPLLRRRIARR